MVGTSRRMGIVTLLSVLAIGCGSSPTANTTLVADLANAAADEAARLLGGKGEVVMIQIPDAPFLPADEAAIDAELKSEFADRGIRIVAVEELPFDPRIETTGEPFDVDTLVDVVSRHPDADLFVSRVGLPRISSGALRRLPDPRPRLMIVTSYQVSYLTRLPPGIPDVAILPRNRGAEAETAAEDEASGFEHLYEIIRAE